MLHPLSAGTLVRKCGPLAFSSLTPLLSHPPAAVTDPPWAGTHGGGGEETENLFQKQGYRSRLAPCSLTWHVCKTDPLLRGHLVGPSGVPWPAPHLLSLALLPLSLRMPGVHTVHTLLDGDPLPSRRQECSQLGGFSLSCGHPTSLAPTRTKVQERPHPAPSPYPQ